VISQKATDSASNSTGQDFLNFARAAKVFCSAGVKEAASTRDESALNENVNEETETHAQHDDNWNYRPLWQGRKATF